MSLIYQYPQYQLKSEFTPGTYSEDNWQLGEIACVSRNFYRLPDDTEYAVFKFCERTHTGRKRLRWEQWYNGHFSNNYFTCSDDAMREIEGRMRFCGFPGPLYKYAVYPECANKK